MTFRVFKTAVAQQFNKLKDHNLFRTSVSKDELWHTYLTSFPEGTNPIFRERTEHDCSCCRQFIGAVGNIVAVIDGKLESIWDCEVTDPAYQVVTDALAALVKSRPIDYEFLSPEKTAGADKNFEQLTEGVKTWEHFFISIPKNFVKAKEGIGPALADSRSTHDVFLRSLNEITQEAIDIVLDLIGQGSLYRGEEHKFAVDSFNALKKKFSKLADDSVRDIFAWWNLKGAAASVTKIRNTAIGTLLTDLSEDMDIEAAVRAFEAKVAPTNYRRPTALITKGMIEQAKKKLAELGLTSALERRFATEADISVNDILFIDRQPAQVNADIFDELSASAGGASRKSFDKIQEVPIDKFIKDILPQITSMDILFDNSHAGNLVSLVAPVDPTARELFKWSNRFSWTYNGEVADSIKEQVKRAGGDVSGDLCCRLAWFNYDDLDLHMVEPGGYEIFYGNRYRTSPNNGRLDVDMNAGRGKTREPVENIFYNNKIRMRDGVYSLRVHNYQKRESDNIGFEVEVDLEGIGHRFSYGQAVANGATIQVAEIQYTRKDGFKIIKSLPQQAQTGRELWGLGVNNFHRVHALMLSPNFWNGHSVGNKHYFFMLEGCVNDGPARGFYNEFLKEELNAHRKVFEVVGSKTRLTNNEEQLSGLGFSSTLRNSLICRVAGSFTRTIKITF